MKRNFKKVLMGFNNKPVVNKDGSATVICNLLGEALFLASPNSKTSIEPGDMMRAYNLANQLCQHPEEVELSTEDATLIKKIAAQTLVAGAYGQVYNIIENEG